MGLLPRPPYRSLREKPRLTLTDSSTPSRAARLQPREPAADWIEQSEHREPDEIDLRQGEAEPRREREDAGQGKTGYDGERMNEIDVHHIEEEGHLAEHCEHLREAAARLIERPEQHQSGAKRHHQKEQRRRVFLAIDEREQCGEPILLNRPQRRVAIKIARAEQDKAERDSRTHAVEEALPRFRIALHHGAEGVARRHHPDPRDKRIKHVSLDAAAKRRLAAFMQDMPEPGLWAQALGADPVEEVVTGDHDQCDRRNGPTRQPDQSCERDHRGADHKNDAHAEAEKIELEPPAELDESEVDEHKPQPAREEKAARLGDASAASIEEGRESGEQDEGRRAKMRYPSGEEQRRLSHVSRIEAAGSEEIARVVERHERDHETAQEIDRDDPALIGRARRRSRRVFRGRNLFQNAVLRHPATNSLAYAQVYGA